MNFAVVGAVVAVLVLLVIYFVYQKISGLQGQVSKLATNLEQIKTILVDNEEVELIARKVMDKPGRSGAQKVEVAPLPSKSVHLPQNLGLRVPPAQPKINAVARKPAGGPGDRDILPNTVEKKIQSPPPALQKKEEDSERAAPPPENSRSDIEARRTPPPPSAADLDAVFGEEVKIVLEMAHKQFGGLQSVLEKNTSGANNAVRCADNAPDDSDDVETDPRTRATFSTMFFDVQSIADSLFTAGGSGGSGGFGGGSGSGVVIQEINE